MYLSGSDGNRKKLISGFELSLFEQLTAEHHAFAFLLVLVFFSDETTSSTSAIIEQNKKALAKLLSYILNQRLQTFALLDLKKSHMEAKEKGVDHLQVFWWECTIPTVLLVLCSQ